MPHYHNDVTTDDLHVACYTVADAAARAALAAVFTNAERGHVVLQLDDGTKWVCDAAASLKRDTHNNSDEGYSVDAAGTVTLKLGDAAGAQSVSITDSTDAEVASVDSNGVLTCTESDTGDVGGGHYLEVKADGEVNLHGTARVKKLVQSEIIAGATAPTRGAVGDYYPYLFTIGDEVHCHFQIPEDWDSTTDIVIKLLWGVDEDYATASGEVQWQADWSCTPDGELWTAPTHTGSDVSGDVNIPATANFRITTTVETIAAANIADEDGIGVKVSRIAIDGGTDPTAEPYIVVVAFEYTSDKLGEAT